MPDKEWDDLLGTGTILKKVILEGRRNEDPDLDMIEAPRKFFALIDIETRLYEPDSKQSMPIIESESHKNYLINCDADLFAGAHLVIPLMDIGEKSRYVFDPKFAYSSGGNLPYIPGNSRLDCLITLKIRSAYDDFLNELNTCERLRLASRKKDRGKFWYSRDDYHNAITIYQSMVDLCSIDKLDGTGNLADSITSDE